eukprot:755893-Hanusia_phi.AAC.2
MKKRHQRAGRRDGGRSGGGEREGERRKGIRGKDRGERNEGSGQEGEARRGRQWNKGDDHEVKQRVQETGNTWTRVFAFCLSPSKSLNLSFLALSSELYLKITSPLEEEEVVDLTFWPALLAPLQFLPPLSEHETAYRCCVLLLASLSILERMGAAAINRASSLQATRVK